MAPTLRAVIFDLGGTLVHFPSWDESAVEKWGASYDALAALRLAPLDREAHMHSMREATLAQWRRVELDTLSEVPPLVTDWSR